MSSIRIDWAGPATSVQDIGRFGAQRYGLGTAGAMDRMALACANAMVGQAADKAAIEIGPLPLKLTILEGPVRLAVAGAERSITVASGQIDASSSFTVQTGDTISISGAKVGVFSYLAIEGGIVGTPVFGSLSVLHRAEIGIPFPRPLLANDVIEVTAASAGPERYRPAIKPDSSPIRLVKGPQDDFFDEDTQARLVTSDWKISLTSDRMGYRLEGPILTHSKGFNIISDGIANGHIQIPGNGQPLVLLADRGTTGGYPKIAAIISADLGRFAQIPAGTPFRFTYVTMDEAQTLYRNMMTSISGLREAAKPIVDGLTTENLLVANVAGHALSAHDPAGWEPWSEQQSSS